MGQSLACAGLLAILLVLVAYSLATEMWRADCGSHLRRT